MKSIVVFLLVLIVGISTSAAVRSHQPFGPLPLTIVQTALDLDDEPLPGHPVPADNCHETCNWLVEWSWPTNGSIKRLCPHHVSAAQPPGPVRLILPPPRWS